MTGKETVMSCPDCGLNVSHFYGCPADDVERETCFECGEDLADCTCCPDCGNTQDSGMCECDDDGDE
jgi:hypothetical protein